MKIIYEIEFDLPDDFPVKDFNHLLHFVKWAVRDRLPEDVAARARFRVRKVLAGVGNDHAAKKHS